MPLMPLMVAGRLRLVNLPAGADAKDQAENADENVRRIAIGKRRSYMEGAQYDTDNDEAMSACQLDPLVDRLPEHLRKHAYSTHLDEAVSFISDQLAETFAVEALAPDVQTLLEEAMMASDQLTGKGESDDPAIDDILYDALIAGDVAVEVKWDPIQATAYYEFWEAEQVMFEWADRRNLTRVTREEIRWVVDPDLEGDKQIVERIVYEVVPNGMYVVDPDGFERPVFECQKATFWDDEDAPRDVEWVGLPFIPWTLLRVSTKALRGMRGESVISDQAMGHADRYNANEQVAWLIARYNSHGNLAVVGDAANLKLHEDGRVSKDIADVITFPGGTDVKSITLPTDPQMIEHQRLVLSDAMFASFGLTRVDPESLRGLGDVSGYALEIMNRKTEGTFRRIRRNWVQDMKTLFQLTIDLVAYRRDVPYVDMNGQIVDVDLLDPYGPVEVLVPQFWLVDPEQEYPVRDVEVRMGSGYIVDDVKVRDDFVAGLISRREALRRRGVPDDEIDQIIDEIEEETPAAPEGAVFGAFGRSTAAGATVEPIERR